MKRGHRSKMNIYDDTSGYGQNIRGKRSDLLLIPDDKKYYKGIKVLKWYWFCFINKFKYIKLIILERRN